MCIVYIANNINRNVYMYLNTRNFPTTGYARVLLFMFIRRELGGMVQDVYFSLHTVLLHNIAPGKYIVIKIEYGLQLHFKIFLNKSDRKKQQQKQSLKCS